MMNLVAAFIGASVAHFWMFRASIETRVDALENHFEAPTVIEAPR